MHKTYRNVHRCVFGSRSSLLLRLLLWDWLRLLRQWHGLLRRLLRRHVRIRIHCRRRHSGAYQGAVVHHDELQKKKKLFLLSYNILLAVCLSLGLTDSIMLTDK